MTATSLLGGILLSLPHWLTGATLQRGRTALPGDTRPHAADPAGARFHLPAPEPGDSAAGEAGTGR
ncbi:hypothetical protein [Streptomyces sp. NBC_00503]|uniref:hypothetical protein n=1 Tax=Streptomyces sp. NBC_00503 TaxID=2903659 RepID=UPI002E80502A|nr:hypothetical protein [Streptomyces sp. NBC_00503]WUD79709.1 hypothetical protein OG490_03430 [Streptomyces sp. NBC_00503]